LSNLFPPEWGLAGIEPAEELAGNDPSAGPSAGAGTRFLLAVDLIPATPSRLGACVLPSLMARRAAKCFSTSIFLIKVIAAPIVLPGSTAAIRAAVDSRSY